jgi:uncharacterized protein
VVRLTPGMLNHAARLAGVHGLRAYDAVRLAAGCAVDAALPDGVAFAAYDKALNTAKVAEGLALHPG